MKLAIISANGRTGQVLVRAALEAGHSVRAGVHHHNPFQQELELGVVAMDATKSADVRRLIAGQDAVISVIGHVRGSAPTLQEQAIRHLIDAMQAENIKRVISLTGTGARLPGDHISHLDRCMNAAVRLIDPARVLDGSAQLQLLQASNLDWTVLRILKLTDGPMQQYLLRAQGPAKPFVSRRTVAQAILEIVKSRQFVQQAPIIG